MKVVSMLMSKPGQHGDAGSPEYRRSPGACSKWTLLTAGSYEVGGNDGGGHSWTGLSPPQHSCLLQHTAGNMEQLLKSNIYTKHGICIIWSGYSVSGKYLLNVN